MKYMLASNVSRLLPNLKATQSSLEFMHGLIEIHHASTLEIQIIISSQDQNETMGYGPPGNIQISLANGNIMKIPLASINISEEVNKTGIWQQVNESNEKTKQSKSLIK